MKNVFPYDSNGKLKAGNPILSSDELRKDEIVKISWFGLRNLPDSSEFIAPSTLRRFTSDLSFTEVSAQIGNENGFFKIFWDLFDDKNLLEDQAGGSLMSVLKFDPGNPGTLLTNSKTRTKFEFQKKFSNNLFTDN
jgi:hypothetical protein